MQGADFRLCGLSFLGFLLESGFFFVKLSLERLIAFDFRVERFFYAHQFDFERGLGVAELVGEVFFGLHEFVF